MLKEKKQPTEQLFYRLRKTDEDKNIRLLAYAQRLLYFLSLLSLVPFCFATHASLVFRNPFLGE